MTTAITCILDQLEQGRMHIKGNSGIQNSGLNTEVNWQAGQPEKVKKEIIPIQEIEDNQIITDRGYH